MSDNVICTRCGQLISCFDGSHLCEQRAPIAALPTLQEVSQDSELDRLRAENARLQRIKECAKRLVETADANLGGCLSDDSPARDIPSNAVSMVKARHLASLRAALGGQDD